MASHKNCLSNRRAPRQPIAPISANRGGPTIRQSRTIAKLRFFLAIAVLAVAPCAAAPAGPGPLLELRQLDQRMAVIANRLIVANAPLCESTMPATGMVLHALAQYAPELRETARAVFDFGSPLAVEAVTAGSAAEAAGIRAGDGLVAINGQPVSAQTAESRVTSASRDAAERRLASLPSDRPIELSLIRAGKPLAATITPEPACRTRFEVSTQINTLAQSDGETIQIDADFLQRYDDDALAVIMAHELAHTVLRHRVRLDRAGVSKGLLAEFGRNGRLNRRAEDEADVLSVSLLRNAGIDPEIAPRFWRRLGSRLQFALFGGGTHATPKARARAMAAEIARIPSNAPPVYRPPILDSRDRPFD